jgi:hypothetical protein
MGRHRKQDQSKKPVPPGEPPKEPPEGPTWRRLIAYALKLALELLKIVNRMRTVLWLLTWVTMR